MSGAHDVTSCSRCTFADSCIFYLISTSVLFFFLGRFGKQYMVLEKNPRLTVFVVYMPSSCCLLVPEETE